MEIINRCLTVREFEDYIENYYFGVQPANRLVIHHTWRPTSVQWQGQISINILKAYYEKKGWPAGPHVFVAEDGIWLFSPMNKDGIHAAAFNHRTIGIEVVGDYDNQVWSGSTKNNALGAIKALMKKLSLNESDILFHRDSSQKTCPGTAITKQWLFGELKAYQKSVPVSTNPKPVSDSPIKLPSVNEGEILIPIWASDAVSFVLKHRLFDIKTDDDVRDAVKFYRFYNLIRDA